MTAKEFLVMSVEEIQANTATEEGLDEAVRLSKECPEVSDKLDEISELEYKAALNAA